jgi:hypothetical protein
MDNLPVPMFSQNNPYWQPLRIAGVFPDNQPLLSAQDYFFATTWELNRFWLQGKLCLLIRRMNELLWRYMTYINFRNAWKDEVRALRASKAVPFSKGEQK